VRHRASTLAATFAVLIATLSGTGALAQTAAEYNAEGVSFYDGGEWKKAIDSFNRALDIEGESPVIRSNLANAYQAYAGAFAEAGDHDTAIGLLHQVLPLDPSNAVPLIQLGAYYLHESMVDDAIFRLEEAVELAPDDIDAHFLLGEAYYKDNDPISALLQWQWVEAVDPDREGLAERIEIASREERVEADFEGQTSRHFNVTYDREAESSLVREVLGYLEGAYREIGQTLGRAYPPTPIQVTLYTLDGFSESTQLDAHVGAVYDGSRIRCPVFDRDGERLPADELRRRLYHEYVHVVVRHITAENVPWWINEGLAEALSNELDETELLFLRRAHHQDALFALADLTDSQLGALEVAALNVAYRQSHATVGYLKDRYGARRFATLLAAIAEGEDAELALRRAFRHSYRTLELAVADFIENG